MTIMSSHRLLKERLKRYVPEPDHYLSILGVDPTRQGRGIGSALRQPIPASVSSTRCPPWDDDLDVEHARCDPA